MVSPGLQRTVVRRAADRIAGLPVLSTRLYRRSSLISLEIVACVTSNPFSLRRAKLFLRLDRLGLDEFQNFQVPVSFQMNPSPSVASFWLSIL